MALHTDKLLIQKCSLHGIQRSELHDIEATKESLIFMLPVHARPHALLTRTLSWNSKKQRILTLTESECSVILILVFLCQQTLRVDMVCVWACLLSRLETGLVPISSSDPLPSVLSAISTGVGKGSTLPIGPIWG